MAQRRMFSKDITNSDEFLDMPLSTQALYFHLGMNADDDGFVPPRSIIRLVQAKDDDLKVLTAKGFAIPFKDSVIVITHWKTNNEIKKDRYKPTIYQDHLKFLGLNNGKYDMSPECLQNVSNLDTQVRLGKVRLGKVISSAVAEDSEDKATNLSKVKKNKSKKLADLPTENGEIVDPFSKDVQKLMCFFHDNGNPTINFAHKGNRDAARELIKLKGYEEIEKWAKFALTVKGRMYAPVISTPYALKNKFSDLEAYRDRLIEERKQKGFYIIKNNQQNNVS